LPGALDVHVEEERCLLDVLFVQRNLLTICSGIVVEEVEPPVFFDGALDECFDLCGPAHVGRLEDRRAARLTDRLNNTLTRRGVTTADDELSPRHGRGIADARTAASHDADFTSQVCHINPFFLRETSISSLSY
jgi:hypothetical protein